MSALKRVEELLSRLTGAASRVSGVVVDVSDLRAVLALAKEAAELKRRVRLTRAVVGKIRIGSLDEERRQLVAGAFWLLDLRKPPPKKRSRK